MPDEFNDPYAPPPVNPYAPPEVDLTPEFRTPGKPGGGPIEPFSASLVIGRAWQLFKRRWGLVIGAVMGSIALNYMFQIVMQLGFAAVLNAMGEGPAVLFALVVQFVAVIAFSLWISCGQTVLLLKLARNEPAEFADLFRGGPYIVPFALASLVVGLLAFGVVFGVAVPLGAVGAVLGTQQSPAFTLATIVAVLAGGVALLYVMARVYTFPYLIVDRGVGALDSVRGAWELSRGKAVEIMGLVLAAGLIALLGFLACFVGAIVTVPLAVFIYACMYVALTTGLPRDFYLEPDYSNETI